MRVYSNAPATELMVNGRSAGMLSDCAHKICVWKDVRLAVGANAIVARGRFADTIVEDRVGWQLAAENVAAIRIDSGAILAAESRAGRFGSDNFFQGGEAGTVDKPRQFGKPLEQPPVAGTADREIAATFRQGDFGYRVPLATGRYTATLTFVEPSAAPGERVFDVLANGRRALSGIDFAKAAGAPLTAIKRSFPVTVRDGLLDLRIKPSRGQAIVSAVGVSK